MRFAYESPPTSAGLRSLSDQVLTRCSAQPRHQQDRSLSSCAGPAFPEPFLPTQQCAKLDRGEPNLGLDLTRNSLRVTSPSAPPASRARHVILLDGRLRTTSVWQRRTKQVGCGDSAQPVPSTEHAWRAGHCGFSQACFLLALQDSLFSPRVRAEPQTAVASLDLGNLRGLLCCKSEPWTFTA
jgi:hypothetical protein